jgi:hypothetical protein
MTISIFAQEKDHQLTYDVHRKIEFPQKAIEGFDINLEDLNKAASTDKKINVFVGKDFSLIETPKKINNSQGENKMVRPLRPEWLLNDYKANLSYENFEHFEIPLKSTLKEPVLTPTRNTKKILNLDAKEYTFEDADFIYSVWLTKLKDLSGSPLYYQFKGFLVLEVKMIGKIINEKSPKQEFRYVLTDIKEVGAINYIKLIPKRTSSNDSTFQLKKVEQNEGVDKD